MKNTFKKYYQHVNEIFTDTYDWNIGKQTTRERDYFFTTEKGIQYKVFFLNNQEGWEVMFSNIDKTNSSRQLRKRKGNIRITGTGDAFKVFGTVYDIIKDFLKRTNAGSLFFYAKEPSRVKLYDRMSSILGKKHGYSVDKQNAVSTTIFHLTKK